MHYEDLVRVADEAPTKAQEDEEIGQAQEQQRAAVHREQLQPHDDEPVGSAQCQFADAVGPGVAPDRQQHPETRRKKQEGRSHGTQRRTGRSQKSSQTGDKQPQPNQPKNHRSRALAFRHAPSTPQRLTPGVKRPAGRDAGAGGSRSPAGPLQRLVRPPASPLHDPPAARRPHTAMVIADMVAKAGSSKRAKASSTSSAVAAPASKMA